MKKLKTKTIPCMIMLLGGLVVLIACQLNHMDNEWILKVLLCTLLACYFLGTLVKIALDRIEFPISESEFLITENLGEEDSLEENFEDSLLEQELDNSIGTDSYMDHDTVPMESFGEEENQFSQEESGEEETSESEKE